MKIQALDIPECEMKPNGYKRNLWYRFKEHMPRRSWIWWYNVKYGIENIFKFLPTIWRFRTWDYHFNLDLFAKSIGMTADTIEKYGSEIKESKDKKIDKMRRFVWLVENYDRSLSLAEKELGKIDYDGFHTGTDINEWLNRKDPHRRKVYDRSEELEKEMWDEMWTIIRGSENAESKLSDGTPFKYSDDGTDARHYWD